MRLVPLPMAGGARIAGPGAASAPTASRLRHPFAGRLDVAVLCVVATGAALINALAMIGAGGALEVASARLLHTTSRAVAIVPLFVLGMVVVPLAVAVGAAALVQRLADGGDTLRAVFTRLAPAYVPLGFGIWGAHYGFHFLTGALTVVPLTQSLLADYGVALLGAPHWGMAQALPAEWLLPVQLLLVYGGLLGSLIVAYRTARAYHAGAPLRARREIAVMAALAILVALAAVLILSQPMQMRGTFQVIPGSGG